MVHGQGRDGNMRGGGREDGRMGERKEGSMSGIVVWLVDWVDIPSINQTESIFYFLAYHV